MSKVGFAFLVFFAIGSGAAAQEDGLFVVAGRPVDVGFLGDEWKFEEGTLSCSGTGNTLLAGRAIGAGDFVVRAELKIDGLSKSAASFVINDNHFGFEGSQGEMFVEGTVFGKHDLGAPVVEDGVPFELVVQRQGGSLAVAVDGKTIHTADWDESDSVRVGLRPWRSRMSVTSFEAEGNLKEAPKPLPHTKVFESGVGGYHTYRIPAVIATQQGTLLAFCEGRKSGGGDAGNIDMLVKRSEDGGETWSEAQVIWDDGNNTCGNASPVVDQETGIIWLLLTWNLGSDHERQIMAGESQEPRHVYVCSSEDDGQTWSEPKLISDTTRRSHWRWYATGPGNAIQLTRGEHQGRLLSPANHSDHENPDVHPYRSHVLYSDDHGQTWEIGGIHQDRTNESAVVELVDGSILQAMRSYHGKNLRAMSRSDDGGESWSDVYLDPALTTPVCQASILRYSWPEDDETGNKSRILFSSPDGTGRNRISIWVSYDEGKTWPVKRLVYDGSSAYSNLIALPDRQIGLLYERDGSSSISFTKVSLDWLESDE